MVRRIWSKKKNPEHDVAPMLAELTEVRERVNKPVLVRKLAASLKLEQICLGRVHEKVAAWKREDGFHRNAITAERH